MTQPPEGKYAADGKPVTLTPRLESNGSLLFRYGGPADDRYLLHDLLQTSEPCLQVVADRNSIEVFFPHDVLDADGETAYVTGEVDLIVDNVDRVTAEGWQPGERRTVDAGSCSLELENTRANRAGTLLKVNLEPVYGTGTVVRLRLKTLEWQGTGAGRHHFQHPDPNVVFRVVDDPSTSQDWPGC